MVRFVMSSVVHHVIDLDPEEAVEIIADHRYGDWEEWFRGASAEYQTNELLMGPEGSEEEVK